MRVEFNNTTHTCNPFQKQDSPSFTVRYFAFGGRAAPMRYAAFLGGVAYQDEFIMNAKEQKAEGKRRWSGLPEMVVGDQVIGQSNACLRYIGTNDTRIL